MLNFLNLPVLRQYFAVIIANLTVLCVGMNLAWPSPVLVKLRNTDDTVLSRPITEEEGSWIVSIGFAIGILCNFLPALLLDRIGRKRTLILSCAPRLIVCFLFIFATQSWMILVGRAIAGSFEAIAFSSVSTFSSEIANKEVRGSLGTILQIICSLGVVLVLGIGPFVSYITLNVIFTIVVVVSTIPLLFLPDSPYFLYSKGRIEEAIKVLTIFRGSEALAIEEIKDYTANETDESISKKDLMRNKAFLKAAGIVLAMNCLTHFVGFAAIQFYLQTILESTQASVMPEVASVIIGFIQLLASVFTNFVTDRFGRKPILIWTLIGNALGMFGLGTFFKIKEIQGEVNGVLNYLPLVSLILFVFCFSAGLGSVIWVLDVELFEGRTRAVGFSFAMASSSTALFLSTKLFPLVTEAVGAPVTYWGFCGTCILTCFFTIFCVPETKGRSFDEIQKILTNEK